MASDKNSNGLVLNVDDPRFRIKPFQQMTASCTGAILTSFFMTPFDVVKIRLQSQQKVTNSTKCYLYCNGLMDHLCACEPGLSNLKKQKPYTGTVDALMKITRTEGPSTLWSGLYPTLFLALPSTVIYFVSYEQMRVKANDLYIAKTGNKTQPLWIPLLVGSLARTISVCIVSPIELVRTKMQSQKKSFADTKDAVKELIKYKGVRGLWRGLTPTLFRDVPFSGLYWGSYETIKKQFGHDTSANNNLMFNFIAGGISGSIAGSMTLPFDVVKTHQQIELGEKAIFSVDPKYRPKGSLEMIRIIYRRNGIRGLFAGLTARILKVAPACAIMITTFEYGKVFFQEYNMKNYNADDKKSPSYFISYGQVTEMKP